MCSRHAELGAGHPDWNPRPFRVKVVDEQGPSWYIEVHAIGRHDAREQARAKAVEQGAQRPGVLAIEEVAA